MDNPAPAEHAIHELMAHRWSPRAYDSKPIDKVVLARCFEAARWAPSSYNEQPWSFVVASRQDGDAYEKILKCLIDFNQGWAKQADVLGIGISALRFQKNDKPNAHDRHDLGMALMSLALQAQAEGLALHMMAGFDSDAARQALNIPDGHEAVTAFALGHPGDPASLDDGLREKETAPRSRKPLGDFVYAAAFGQKAPWV